MFISFACLLIFTSVSLTASLDFSLKGDPCSKFDSCYSKPALRTCSCDSDCHVYGTCCHDLKKQPQQDDSSGTFRCYHRRTATPVFVKRSCSEDFRGHVGDKFACLDDDEDEMDVQNNLLVTSYKTKNTYWNKHCAICNNEANEDLEVWNIEVFCPHHKDVDRNLIRRNLTFDQDKSQWGLEIDGEFLQCIVKYSPPPYIDEVKHCTPNLVASCPANFTNQAVATRCLEYYAERKLKQSDTYYKNVHCAICNGVDVRDLDCPGITTPEDNVEETDFREMVEEVFTKGEWLDKEPGKRFECSKGFSYDPTRTKCRRDTTLDEVVTTIPNSSNMLGKESVAILVMLFFVLF